MANKIKFESFQGFFFSVVGSDPERIYSDVTEASFSSKILPEQYILLLLLLLISAYRVRTVSIFIR